jgi:Ankyrin repeats (3 copies)
MQSHELVEIQDSKSILYKGTVGGESIRPIVVIAGFPFYCSTGDNSGIGAKGTWFPFSGINHETFLEENKEFKIGWLIKPEWDEKADLSKYFPQKLVDNFSQLLKPSTDEQAGWYSSVISRFGNFEAMCISMILNEGFWQSEGGIKLKNFIAGNFKQELETILKYYSDELKEAANIIHNPNTTLIKILEDTKENIQEINNWLITHGSKSNKDVNNRPKINFSYNTISINTVVSIDLFIKESTHKISNFFSNSYTTAVSFFKDTGNKIQSKFSSFNTNSARPEPKEDKAIVSQNDAKLSNAYRFFNDDEHGTEKSKEISMFELMRRFLTDKDKSRPAYLLAEAIHSNNIEKIELLISQYPLSELQELGAENGNFYPPFHIACEEGKFDIVSILVSRGFEVNLPADNCGWRTPLSIAVENNHESIVKFLLEHKANINAKDNFGRTPLDWKKSF